MDIVHDGARARHRLDFDRTASVLTLGCLLESIRIAASDCGLKAEFRLTSDFTSRREAGADELWAQVEFSSIETSRDELFSALSLRATDRRIYRPGDIPPALLNKIRDEQRAFPGTHLYWLANPVPKDLSDFLARGEAFLIDDSRSVQDVLKWVRFGRKSALETRDGMPWQGLGLKLPEVMSFRLLKKYPGVISVYKKLGMVQQMQASIRKQIASSAGLLCVTVNSLERKALVPAGQLFYRAWLRLNLAGFGVQPTTMSALGIYASRSNMPEEIVPARWISHFRESEPSFKKAFAIPESETPAWMMRTGPNAPLGEKAQTLRLPIDRILETGVSDGE